MSRQEAFSHFYGRHSSGLYFLILHLESLIHACVSACEIFFQISELEESEAGRNWTSDFARRAAIFVVILLFDETVARVSTWADDRQLVAEV